MMSSVGLTDRLALFSSFSLRFNNPHWNGPTTGESRSKKDLAINYFTSSLPMLTVLRDNCNRTFELRRCEICTQLLLVLQTV
jgi:hypothetical protein